MYVNKDVPLRSLVLMVAMMNFCVLGPAAVGLPYLVKTKLGSATAYGIAVTALAVGGLAGSLLAGVWRVRRRATLILPTCAIIGVTISILGFLGSVWTLSTDLAIMGAASGITNVHVIAWIQQRIEPAMRGRVMSVVMLAAIGLAPVSLAFGGFLAAWNLVWNFLIAGGALVLVVAVGALQKEVREIQ